MENGYSGLDVASNLYTVALTGRNVFVRNGVYGIVSVCPVEVPELCVLEDNGHSGFCLNSFVSSAGAIAEAYRRQVCTVATLGPHDEDQEGWSCVDCGFTGNYAVCRSCAKAHERAGHDVFFDERAPLICDCFFGKCDVCPHTLKAR